MNCFIFWPFVLNSVSSPSRYWYLVPETELFHLCTLNSNLWSSSSCRKPAGLPGFTSLLDGSWQPVSSLHFDVLQHVSSLITLDWTASWKSAAHPTSVEIVKKAYKKNLFHNPMTPWTCLEESSQGSSLSVAVGVSFCVCIHGSVLPDQRAGSAPPFSWVTSANLNHETGGWCQHLVEVTSESQSIKCRHWCREGSTL